MCAASVCRSEIIPMEHSDTCKCSLNKDKERFTRHTFFQTPVCLSHGVPIGVSVCLAMCMYMCGKKWSDGMNFNAPVIHCENIDYDKSE